jgi:hypothetical protein
MESAIHDSAFESAEEEIAELSAMIEYSSDSGELAAGWLARALDRIATLRRGVHSRSEPS